MAALSGAHLRSGHGHFAQDVLDNGPGLNILDARRRANDDAVSDGRFG
jgi:hypothetical protein